VPSPDPKTPWNISKTSLFWTVDCTTLLLIFPLIVVFDILFCLQVEKSWHGPAVITATGAPSD